MLNILPSLIQIYGIFLSIPINDPFRIRNNDIYARIADEIGQCVGLETEQVQLFCEAVVQASKQNGHH